MAKSSEKPPPPATHAFSSPTTDLVTKSVPPTAVMYGDAAGKSGLNRLRKKARVRQRESRNRGRRGRDSLLEEPAALAPADALVARREEDGEAARARLHEGLPELTRAYPRLPEERPRAPAFMKAVFAVCMYSADTCCFSSLPYETEWT